MSSSKPTTPRRERRQTHGNRRHLHRSSGIHLPSLSPKVQHYPIDADNLPMDSAEITEKFSDIAKSLETLDSNMHDLNRIHDNLSNQFNESFASFLYGLSMTMWCVDFPGCPSRVEWENLMAKREQKERIKRLKKRVEDAETLNHRLKESLAEKLKLKPKPQPVAAAAAAAAAAVTNPRVMRPARNVSFKPSLNESSISSITSDRRPMGTRIRQGEQASRIPQPGRVSKPQLYLTSNSRTGPNLNQPPRYMRGLFDGSNISNTANYERVKKPTLTTAKTNDSLANRPPFR
ncbi:DASH complex subunit DAM1 [Candida viswanathii]|uniref:DASH complex subunit DAM1 n=1 Tax=Candida viswanathii TaxID=5486 RepID=A0A367YCA0_9ASCO|nr:DASH complex subunit DAM1 [Candida viswanathii]